MIGISNVSPFASIPVTHHELTTTVVIPYTLYHPQLLNLKSAVSFELTQSPLYHFLYNLHFFISDNFPAVFFLHEAVVQ